MDNLELCTQVLFKKYSEDHPWLTYNDLRKIVEKFSKDPLSNNFQGSMNAAFVKSIHGKVYPVVEKIQQVKTIRLLNVEDERKKIPEPIMEKPPISHNTLTPTLSHKTYYVLVDSKDRNVERWANNNPFQFSLGPSSVNLMSESQHNSVYRSFSDVHCVTVKKVIIPSIDLTYPYLLLNINELGSNVNGTNDDMNNAFGHLTIPVVYNGYAHYNYEESYETIIELGQTTHMTKIFSPRIEISKLTFDIKAPDGTSIEFPEDKSVVVELQIVCLRKELENTMLLRPG